MTDRYGFFQTTHREDGEIIAQMGDKERLGEGGFADIKKALEAEKRAKSAVAGAFSSRVTSGVLMRDGVMTMTENELISLLVNIEVSRQPMPASIAAIERAVVCIDAKRKAIAAPKLEDTHKRYTEVAGDKHMKIASDLRARMGAEVHAKAPPAQVAKAVAV